MVKSSFSFATTEPSTPLVRLSTVKPFVNFLKERRFALEGCFEQFGLQEAAVHDSNRMVHADVVYGLLNAFADAAKDPFLGVHVAEFARVTDWVFAQHFDQTEPVLASMLIHLIEATPSYGKSVRHSLDVQTASSHYRVERLGRSGNPPGHVDGMAAALHLKLLDTLEKQWDPGEVTITTRFPEAIPPNYRGVAVEATDKNRFSITFPTAWCHQKLQLGAPSARIDPEMPASLSLISALDAVVPNRLADGTDDLRAACARDLGVEPTELDRALKLQGTTFAKEIRAIRMRCAHDALKGSNAAISEIASQLGFSNAANFTRFFKSETRTTPRAYRQAQTGRGQGNSVRDA